MLPNAAKIVTHGLFGFCPVSVICFHPSIAALGLYVSSFGLLERVTEVVSPRNHLLGGVSCCCSLFLLPPSRIHLSFLGIFANMLLFLFSFFTGLKLQIMSEFTIYPLCMLVTISLLPLKPALSSYRSAFLNCPLMSSLAVGSPCGKAVSCLVSHSCTPVCCILPLHCCHARPVFLNIAENSSFCGV